MLIRAGVGLLHALGPFAVEEQASSPPPPLAVLLAASVPCQPPKAKKTDLKI